jgi:hypothetical protein
LLAKGKVWKMNSSSRYHTALVKAKEEPRRTGSAGEQPLSGVDSESSDDTMGDSSMKINFTIPGVAAGDVLVVHKTTL